MSGKTMKRILVTGATGQIGSELTMELRKKYGSENVIAAGHRRKPSEKLVNSGPFEYIDVTNREIIEKLMKKYDINTIYHLAAVLSAIGEEKPQITWKANMDGLYNVLEIAREHGLVRVFWPSSMAVFGPEAPRINTPQDAVLIPRTMYGVTKVAGELLCNYYFLRFGIDVRSVRYPGIISSETLPGGGTTDYAVEIFYGVVKKKRYTCFVREDTVLPMMYMPDCIKAAIDLMEAGPSRITCRTSYNVTGYPLYWSYSETLLNGLSIRPKENWDANKYILIDNVSSSDNVTIIWNADLWHQSVGWSDHSFLEGWSQAGVIRIGMEGYGFSSDGNIVSLFLENGEVGDYTSIIRRDLNIDSALYTTFSARLRGSDNSRVIIYLLLENGTQVYLNQAWFKPTIQWLQITENVLSKTHGAKITAINICYKTIDGKAATTHIDYFMFSTDYPPSMETIDQG